jgi:hypothetical protein
MSRKGQHHKAVAGKRAAGQAADLPGRAAAAFAAGRFKEATELYKALLKQERRPEWLDALAAGYAGRAHDLAGKGMLQEALALWRTRADLCGKPLLDGPYAEWLVRSGELRGAFDLLADERLSAESRAQLEARLAAGALAAPEEALARVPADSALVRHRPAAQAALAALATGDAAELDAQLRAIPFRSPYRDLRFILKALASIAAGAPEAAAAALERLPADGPFEALASAARTALLPPGQWLAALGTLAPDAQQLLLDLAACPAARRPLVLELARLGAAPDAASLLDLLLRHRRHLPDAAARLVRRLLPYRPQQLQTVHAAFGALPRGEGPRVLALAAERAEDAHLAERHWLQFVDDCDTGSADGRCVAAQALRRIADGHHHPEQPGGLCEDALDWIARSVALDPGERASHLRLIRATRARDELKAARGHLETALRHFPDDAEVLLEAVETALAGNSFKKAAGLARRVLALDPINPRVRGIVGQAHLGHARKHIKAGKIDAARKELDEAAEWLRAPQARAPMALLRGLAEDDGARAEAALRGALAELGAPPLVGGFLLAREAASVRTADKRALRALLKRVGIAPDRVPAPNEVLALMRALDGSGESGQTPRQTADKALAAAFQVFHDPIARAATARFTEVDHLFVCEALLRHEVRPLAARHAEAALQHWPRHPAFAYLRAMANWGDGPWQMPPDERAALEAAADRAHRHGDPRTAARIDALLEPSVRFDDEYIEGGDGLPDTPFDDPRAALEMLRALGGDRALIEMARQQLGAAAFAELRRTVGGDDKAFARRLIEVIAASGTPFEPARIVSEGGTPPPPPAPRRKPKTRPDGQGDLFDD